MENYYILSIITCKDGVTNQETALFADLETAKVSFSENLNYYLSAAPENLDAYNGYDGKLLAWFEIGETTDAFWVRGDIQKKSLIY